MKRILYLIPFVIFLSLSSRTDAQKIWEQGYIITRDGNVVTGQVMVGKEKKMPGECYFRRFDIAMSSVYRPGDIEGFGYKNGNRYVSRLIKGKATFLECLVIGKVNLYKKSKTLYLESKKHGLTELTYGIIKNRESGREFEDLYSFLGFLLEDSKDLNISENITLKEETLISLITEYDLAADPKNTYRYKALSTSYLLDESLNTRATGLSYGVIAGVNMSQFNSSAEVSDMVFYPDMTTFDFSPMAGIFINAKVFGSARSTRFQAEVHFRRNNVYMYDERYSSGYNSTSRSDITFNFTGIKVPVMLSVPLGSGKYMSYLNFGVAYSTAFSTDYLRIFEVEYPYGVIRTYEDRSFDISKSEISALGGAGLKINLTATKYCFVETRGEYGMGLFINSNNALKSFKTGSLNFCVVAGISF